MNFQITDAERLILANQYEILGQLQNDTSYTRLSQSLRAGHDYLYRRIFDHLAPVMPADDQNFVIDTLSMYRALNRDAAPADSGITPEDLEFPGFDGNDESDLYFFSCAVAQEGLFSELLNGEGVNSHSHSADTYEKMLAVWRGLGNERSKPSPEQKKAILAARGY